MELISAYLLSIHPKVVAPESSAATVRAEAARDLVMYVPGGLVWAASSLADLPAEKIPEFWKDKVVHCYAQYSPFTIANHVLHVSVTELKSASVPTLIKPRWEFPERVNELYDSLFPSQPTPTYYYGGTRHRYPSILFCQPRDRVAADSIPEFASDALALIGYEQSAVFPALLQNALFVPGPYSIQEYDSVAAFALDQLPSDKDITIPHIVREMLDYQAFAFILENLHYTLASVPFVRRTVAEYLASFETGTRSSYSERFLTYLSDSEYAAGQLKTMEDFVRLLAEAMSRNRFANTHESAVTVAVCVPEVIRGSVLDLIVNECSRAKTELTSNIGIAIDRQKALGDYLRDAANSEATVANLRLQRLVIILAVITLIIGLVALVPGLLTEEQKTWLWRGFKTRHTTPAPPSQPY